MALEPHFATINGMMLQGCSFEVISQTLKSMGIERGSSVPNLKLLCREKNLRMRGMVSKEELEQAVAQCVRQAGPTYGRKMMQGYLSSQGVPASQRRVAEALRVVNGPYQEARNLGLRNLNPIPYNALYMGQKLHIDQNEKMVMFGVTYVLAIDGYSGKLVSYSIMPIKNNLTIYDEVYKPAVVEYGLWDQVRVDHGREFYLSLFVQEKLSGFRFNQERPSFLQTPSTRNHRIERIWVEVNNRVTYPLKSALVHLVDQERLNMADDTVRYCVSNLTCQVARVGLERFVESWNNHTVTGRGMPNVLAEGGCRVRLTADQLPTATQAADLYDAENNSSLTRTSVFGRNPFLDATEQHRVQGRFSEAFPDLAVLFDETVNQNVGPFQDAVLHLIRLSS